MLYLQTRPNPKEETRASTKRSACYWIRNSTHPDNHLRTSPEPFSRSKNIDSWGRGCLLRQESYTSDYSPTDTLYQRAAELWVSPCFSCMASFIWLHLSTNYFIRWRHSFHSSAARSGRTFRWQRHKPRVQKTFSWGGMWSETDRDKNKTNDK